jgi:hypothetical protein
MPAATDSCRASTYLRRSWRARASMRQLGGPGIPEHVPDVLGFEDLEEDVGT